MNIQFGSGNNVIIGWKNFDKQIDITKSLPFDSDSVDYIFTEHVIEHITQIEGINFLKECYRILKNNGVMRIAFPDVEKIYENNDKEYNEFAGKGSLKNTLEKVISGWNHRAVWTFGLLRSISYSIGFTNDNINYDIEKSNIKELKGLEKHWQFCGKHNSNIETSVIELHKIYK